MHCGSSKSETSPSGSRCYESSVNRKSKVIAITMEPLGKYYNKKKTGKINKYHTHPFISTYYRTWRTRTKIVGKWKA